MNIIVALFLLIIPTEAFSACVSGCINEPNCYDLGYRENMDCPNGAILCPLNSAFKWCKQYTCEDGGYRDKISNEVGYACEEVNYHGKVCYKCTCRPSDRYKWDESNKGQDGILVDDIACNGKSSHCYPRPECKEVQLPAQNVKSISTCVACSKTIVVGYECYEGFGGPDCL